MSDSPTQQVVAAPVRTHHKYSPSKMNYLDECAAFEGKQNDVNEAAEQGTFLHDLMEQMIRQVINGKAKTTLEQVAQWVTVNHELADDEVEYLRICCRRVDIFIKRKPTKIVTEIKVVVKNTDGSDFNSGYLDVLFIYGPVGIMLDFKFGWEPVRPASTNLQGVNYTVGVFQLYPELQRIGVEFLQPKLSATPTGHVFERRDTFALLTRLQEVVGRAKYTQSNPDDAQKFMKPGSYCKYCARAATCAVLNNHRALAATKYVGLPLPVSFKGLEIKTPEEAALAKYWCELIEGGIEEVKKRALELANANEGVLEARLPNGEVIRYEIKERNTNRVLGAAPEVADALKDFCTPQEILGAATLAIGDLETIIKNAMVTLAKAKGEKLTKKAAWEQIQSLLEAQGLLSRPDTKIRYLKLQKETKALKE